jgi:hypothetical protein
MNRFRYAIPTTLAFFILFGSEETRGVIESTRRRS